jgi:hypothetical protein
MSLLFALIIALGASCAGECGSAFDCKSNELCYRASCTPRNPAPLCTVTDDCGEGAKCIAGKCEIGGGQMSMTSTMTSTTGGP